MKGTAPKICSSTPLVPDVDATSAKKTCVLDSPLVPKRRSVFSHSKMPETAVATYNVVVAVRTMRPFDDFLVTVYRAPRASHKSHSC